MAFLNASGNHILSRWILNTHRRIDNIKMMCTESIKNLKMALTASETQLELVLIKLHGLVREMWVASARKKCQKIPIISSFLSLTKSLSFHSPQHYSEIALNWMTFMQNFPKRSTFISTMAFFFLLIRWNQMTYQ